MPQEATTLLAKPETPHSSFFRCQPTDTYFTTPYQPTIFPFLCHYIYFVFQYHQFNTRNQVINGLYYVILFIYLFLFKLKTLKTGKIKAICSCTLSLPLLLICLNNKYCPFSYLQILNYNLERIDLSFNLLIL